MKIVVMAVLCLFCGALLGVVLSMTLFFGGFKFPGTQPSQAANQADKQASSSPSESNLPKIESIPARNDAELSILAEQSAVPTEVALSDGLQFHNLGAVNLRQSSIAEQQQVLSLIAGASLDELNDAIASIADDKKRLHENHWVIGLITQRRIELDPDGTLQEINQIISQQGGMLHDNMASYLLMETYALMRPQSLIEWLSSLPDDAVESDQLMALFAALAQSAPESAMDLVMRNNSLASNEYGGQEMILYNWSEKDPLAALQWLEQNGDQQLLEQHVELIISQLASRDPEAAKTAAARFPGLVSEDMFVIQEIEALVASDPLAAIEMAKSIPDSASLVGAMESLFYTWGSTDPIAAFEHLESIADTNKRAMYAQIVGDSLASFASRSQTKRLELLSWSESLSPDLQMVVRRPILSEWASYDPGAAIEWLNTQGDWSNNPDLVQSIAWNLPEHDLEKAMEIYSSADQETQMVLSEGIVSKLYRNNPQSAWNWYEGLPENDAKQASLFGLVMMTAEENPHQALDLVDSMIDGGNTEMIQEVLHFLSYQYPDQVESWLATANIDEERKTEIRVMMAEIRRETIGFPMHEGRPSPILPGPLYRLER